MRRKKSIDYSLLLISLLLYSYLGFMVQRHETLPLLLSYFFLFGIYIYILKQTDEENTNFWLYASILFRAVLIFSVPNLSDDFYRFIWDGRLWSSGYHPFAEVPSFYIKNDITIPGIDEELFQKLNSPDYFTVYPPLAQFIFWLSVKLSPHSIYGSLLILKAILFAAEIGSVIVIKKLLAHFKLPQTRVLLYALNPLVIVELVGNIHMEGVLIFLLLLSILLLSQQKLLLSEIFFSMAICVKLIPLIFLPALLPQLGWKKALQFYLVIGITCAIFFIPLLDKEIISGFQNSLVYYFNKFEFNASIYYLVRLIGYWLFGFNVIHIAGWMLGVVSLIFIVAISLVGSSGFIVQGPRSIVHSPWSMVKRKIRLAFVHESSTIDHGPSTIDYRLSTIDHRLLTKLTFILLTFFLFTTTLHPWYITTLLAVSIFIEFRFAVVWTALIFLTYVGYSANGFDENLWITAIEYVSVLGYLAYELVWKRKGVLSQQA